MLKERLGTANLLAAIFVLCAVALAYQMRFVQDDAFISFRYADNLRQGYGLVWEPGVVVQGYTNFLWTIWLAGLNALGVPFENGAIFSGLACFLVTLIFAFRTFKQVFSSPWLPLGLLFILSTNFSFLAYGTGGLETGLQTCLYVVVLWIFSSCRETKVFSGGQLLGMSLLFGALMLVRLDSAFFIACIGLATLFHQWRGADTKAEFGAGVLRLALPGLVILGAYLVWCYSTYGNILPNTFYAKTSAHSKEILVRGFNFTYRFLADYGFLVPVFVAGVTALFLTRRMFEVAVAAYLALWFAYVAWVGGGFMEFRLFMPALPAMVLLFGIAWEWFQPSRPRILGPLVAAGFALGSAGHGENFGRDVSDTSSIKGLSAQIWAWQVDWGGIGKNLAMLFPGSYETGPMIAVTPAGAIPFYSRLRAIDMYGLNDREIARTGIQASARPGHQRIIDAADLVARKPNLILGHPQLFKTSDGPPDQVCLLEMRLHTLADSYPAEILGARFVSMEVNTRYSVLILYLEPHAEVDAQVSSGALNYVATRPADCGGTFEAG